MLTGNLALGPNLLHNSGGTSLFGGPLLLFVYQEG